MTTFTYDTYERPLTTTDTVGVWSVRYETVRGLPDTLITPLGDTIINSINSRGQLVDRSIRSGGQKLNQSFYHKQNASMSHSSSTPTGSNGNYNAALFERVTGDTGWIALSPTWTQELGAAGPTQVLQDSTAYDAWGRLTRWNGMKDGVSVTAETYTFDRTGNIRQPTDSTPNYHATTDRLLGRQNGAGRDSLRYDRAGNLIQLREASGGPIWDYGYDALERLVSVRRNSTLIARYGYDVLGRRIAKKVYSSASGGTVGYIRFVYRGGQVGYETSETGTIGLKYTYGGTDQLLAITDGATHYYVTTDKLGSVRGLAKRDGTWAMTQRFAAYGTRMSRDTSVSYGLGTTLRYGWTGREYDAETGFSFHRARYYLSTLRRWTQEDPIGFAGGSNIYAYAGGTPLEARDPSGLIEAWVGSFQGFCSMSSCIDPFGSISHGAEYAIDGVSAGGGSAFGGLIGYGLEIVSGISAAGILSQRQDLASLLKKAGKTCSVLRPCPGGLTFGEYGKTLTSIQQIDHDGTQAGLVRLLLDSRIRPVNEPLRRDGYMATGWESGDIYVTRNWAGSGRSVFSMLSDREFAFGLAHEYAHHRALMATSFAWRAANATLRNDPAFDTGFETGSDAFACNVVSGDIGRFADRC